MVMGRSKATLVPLCSLAGGGGRISVNHALRAG
jgi:hypothetical protein